MLGTDSSSTTRRTSLLLILATVFWGCSFTWAKHIGEVANATLGMGQNHPAGPVLMVGFRFTLAAVVWFALFPQSWRGWTFKSLGRGLIIASTMSAAMIAQMIGLDRTSAPVSAFLTALTVLFVPLMSVLFYFRSPSRVLWIGVALATAGIWLMTGATPGGFGLGEALGLACAILFSIEVLAVNALIPKDNAFRITGIMFLFTGLSSLAVAGFMLKGNMAWTLPLHREVWPRLAALILLPTLCSYGILTFYQPKIDATRAAILYLFEPVFSAIYDYIETGRLLSFQQMLGATLIIVANLLVELWGAWWERNSGKPRLEVARAE